MSSPRARRAFLALLAGPTLAACVSAGHLAEYDFRDRTVAVVAVVPPRPFVDSGDDVDLSGLSVLEAAVKVGSGVYKESQAGKLRARLDSASTHVDASHRISGGVLERSARLLGARAVDTSADADFHLEVRVEEYGVESPEWNSEVRFRLKAEMLLLDRDGREVWKGSVNEDEELAESWFLPGHPATDVWTGRALGGLRVEELVLTLEAIADHTADRLTEKLRKGLEKARG